MAVLKTTSPTVVPSAPMPQPLNTLPSARTRTAGVFCDTNVLRINATFSAGVKKAGERKSLGLIPLSLVEDYSRKRALLTTFAQELCGQESLDPQINADERSNSSEQYESFENALGLSAFICVYLRIQSLSSTQAEDVLHVVQAGRLAGEEARGAHGALRVSSAARGAVRDLDALAGAGEKDGVVADRIAAARDREADRPRLALAGHAVAREHRVLLERGAARACGDLAQLERGARRRVDLHLVVHLEDFRVVIGAERLRRHRHQLHHHVHAHAHVGRHDDGDVLRGRVDLGKPRRSKARRSDDHRALRAPARAKVRERALGAGEVSGDLRGLGGRRGIGADDEPARRGAQVARIAPGPFAPGDVKRGGERHSFGRRRRLEERAAHAPAGSRDRDAHRVHLVGGAGWVAPTGGGNAGRASPVKDATLSFSKNTERRVRFSAFVPLTLLK